MNGDAYAKGWTLGRNEAIREVKAALLKARAGEYILFRDALALVDHVHTSARPIDLPLERRR